MRKTGLLSAAVLGTLLLSGFQMSNNTGGHRKRMGDNESPVRVMGGSMTFRSKTGWANNQTQVSGPISVITLDWVRPLGSGGKPARQQQFPTTGKAWAVKVWARGQTNSKGVFVCSNANCDTSGSGTTGQTIFLLSQGGTGFYQQGAVPEDYFKGLRYRDGVTPCKIEQGALCEHIGQIDVIIQGDAQTHKFQCVDGECRVYFDP